MTKHRRHRTTPNTQDDLFTEHLRTNTIEAAFNEIEEGGDPMLHALATVMLHVEDAVDNDGWDMPPRLFALLRRLGGIQGSPAQGTFIDTPVFTILLTEIPFPLVDDVSGYLDYLAKKMRKSPVKFDNLFAFMFISEAYARGHKLSEEEVKSIIQGNGLPGYQHGDYRAMPDSVEIRVTCAVDTVGNIVEINRGRNREGRALLIASQDKISRGRVPDALRAMIDAVNEPLG